MLIQWGVVVPTGVLTRRSLLEGLRFRWGGTRGGDCLFRDRQWPSILLELIGLISLLPRVGGVRSDLWFWNGLGVLGERRLSSGELIHHVLNRLPLGIVPGLVGSERWTDIRDRLFLDLGLSGRSAGGASKGVEWSRELEQCFAGGGFNALLLSLGDSRLKSRFGNLFDRLVYLREIILIYLRSRRLLLRLRWDGRRRGRNGRRRWLRKRRRWFREVWNGGSAEVREVRNRLETIGDGSQNWQTKRCDKNIPRHELIQQKFALVRRVWALSGVCSLHVSRSRRSRDLSRCLVDGLRQLWLHGGHQRRSNVHRSAIRGTGHGTQEREQNICRVIVSRRWGSGGERVRTAAWDGVERAGGGRSRV